HGGPTSPTHPRAFVDAREDGRGHCGRGRARCRGGYDLAKAAAWHPAGPGRRAGRLRRPSAGRGAARLRGRHVRLLLVTHVLLWAAGDPDRLAPAARAQIEARANVRLISAASTWEIAVKHALGKLPLREPPEPFLRRASTDPCADELPITTRHALSAARLAPHRRDAFARGL